jgi:hypothetical protein
MGFSSVVSNLIFVGPTLIALKLSRHVQFADKAIGCVLAQRAAKDGDDTAAPRLDGCRTKLGSGEAAELCVRAYRYVCSLPP